MGLKYLLLIGAIALVVYWLRKAHHGRLERERRQAGRSTRRTETARMRRCARCGLYVPEAEAVRRDKDFFCCREHAERGRPDPPP